MQLASMDIVIVIVTQLPALEQPPVERTMYQTSRCWCMIFHPHCFTSVIIQHLSFIIHHPWSMIHDPWFIIHHSSSSSFVLSSHLPPPAFFQAIVSSSWCLWRLCQRTPWFFQNFPTGFHVAAMGALAANGSNPHIKRPWNMYIVSARTLVSNSSKMRSTHVAAVSACLDSPAAGTVSRKGLGWRKCGYKNWFWTFSSSAQSRSNQTANQMHRMMDLLRCLRLCLKGFILSFIEDIAKAGRKVAGTTNKGAVESSCEAQAKNSAVNW